MKVLFHNFYEELNKDNFMFENQDAKIGDNLLKPINLITNYAKNYGIEVGTYSKIKLEEADFFVFIDYPRNDDWVFKYAIQRSKKMFLISYESPIISTEVLKPELHNYFLKVFTWSDFLISKFPNKYIKLNYLHDLKVNFEVASFRKKLFIIIAGNKFNPSQNELYSLRYKCIKWFEKNFPISLDLYGHGWEIKLFHSKSRLGNYLNYINNKYNIFKQKLLCYKGPLNRKSDVLKNYNFSICFENVSNHEGYITEKIFDCFLSGTIPIYKGAPNIEEYIPSDCFINFDKFDSFQHMYKEITQMTEIEIKKYRQNIKNFLESEKAHQFQDTYLSEILVKTFLYYK